MGSGKCDQLLRYFAPCLLYSASDSSMVATLMATSLAWLTNLLELVINFLMSSLQLLLAARTQSGVSEANIKKEI